MPQGVGGNGYAVAAWQSAKYSEATTGFQYLWPESTEGFANLDPAENTVDVVGGDDYVQVSGPPGKANSAFDLPGPLRPSAHIWLLKGMLPKSSRLTPISDTVKAATPIATAAQVSTVTPTTGTGFALGQIGLFAAAGATQEIRPIIDVAGTPQVLKVPGLQANAAGVNPLPVTVPAQNLLQDFTIGDTGYPEPPYLTFIVNEYGTREMRQPDIMVSRWALTANPQMASVTVGLQPCGAMPYRKTSGLFTYAPTNADQDERTRWYTGSMGLVVAPNDQLAAGTSGLYAVKPCTQYSVTFTRTTLDQDGIDLGSGQADAPAVTHSDFFNGGMTCEISYTYTNRAGRNATMEDVILPGPRTQHSAFLAFFAVNIGTPTVPSWRALCLAFPDVVWVTAPKAGGTRELETITVTGRPARGNNGARLINAYIMSDAVAAF